MDAPMVNRRGKVEYDRRQEAMEKAWMRWRAEVIEAAAARVKEIGNESRDDELELLLMELDHVAMVRHALSCELGIDPRDEHGGGNE